MHYLAKKQGNPGVHPGWRNGIGQIASVYFAVLYLNEAKCAFVCCN